MRVVVLVSTMLAGALQSACCGDSTRPAVALSAIDTRTGRPATLGATVIVEGSGFRDSVVIAVEAAEGQPAYLAVGPAADEGRYTVTVRKPGYRTWTQRVEVDADFCGKPRTAVLTARLEPAPAAGRALATGPGGRDRTGSRAAERGIAADGSAAVRLGVAPASVVAHAAELQRWAHSTLPR